ncbi:siderophore-interacting protein [Trujillonella endophytica]|uniref:NADPH-dependent ferric siderophore reductase, contains FAD-binding and SIP domains n=1 Tax=Trujillonella endophytica TaxID=673521 RepID=A0A1H8T0T6_9ACTN|nr:siderophore-interacting protein [Trujillella endophytica]SEO84425.1 NADPH-dependent ferric siderophore reductase, contains FAD-binding and SIP domains [Trujillella endophytica]
MTGTTAAVLPAVDFDLPADEAAELAEGLDHIGDEHPDTVLLVARALGAEPDARSVDILGVGPDGLRLAVGTTDGSQRPVQIPFRTPVRTSLEIYGALMGLVAAARGVVGTGEPLTSIEAEFLEDQTMTTVAATVSACRLLAPNLLEITLAGLAPLPLRGGDEYVVLMPDPPAEVLRPGFSVQDLAGIPLEAAPRAAYTMRARRPASGEGDVWLVLHGDEGAVSSRLAAAGPGTPIAVWGTRRSYDPPAGVRTHLLVCDETALGAVAAVLDGLAPDARAVVVAETADAGGRPDLPVRPGVEVRWVDRSGAAPGTTPALLDGVRAALAESPLLADRDGVFVFGAGEAARMRELRTSLRQETGLARDRVRLTGYWNAAR